MEGYSVTEAASILGVPTERVWELLARGVLAGTSEGETGMRVYLQPRPAPAPAPIVNEPGRPNGNSEPREPERELSPFRELLTEFRNLTERYGQALLALGESRGEVATLRSRVDLLEARMDLRLPMAGFTPPAPSSPWPAPSAERAVSPSVEGIADDHGADDGEEDHDRPARRRRSSQRRATEAFAEALARAEDPTRSELPGASGVATALAALRGEPTHPHGAAATEAVLPRELPAADLMPRADEEPVPDGEARDLEPVAAAPPEFAPKAEPEPLASSPEPVTVEPEPVTAEPEPEPVTAEPEPEPEPVPADAAEPTPVTTEPEPVPADAAEPMPVTTEPEPIPAEPEPEDLATEPEADAVPAEPAAVELERPESAPAPQIVTAAAEPVIAAEPEPEAVAGEAGPNVVAAEPEPVAVASQGPELDHRVVARPEPIGVDRPEPTPEREIVAAEPEPVAVEPPAEPEVAAAAPEPATIQQPEPANGDTAYPRILPVRELTPFADVTAGVDVATPAGEVPPIVEPDAQPEPEAVAVAADQESEPDIADVESEAAPPTGEEPDAVEPIAWDRERYTVDIAEPDWFAGEEPEPGGHAAPSEASATEEAADGPRSEPADARPLAPGVATAAAATEAPEVSTSVPEPTPPPSTPHDDEETMLWFGRQPTAPAPAEEPAEQPADEPSALSEGPDDGASEMEVAGSGHRAVMPGSQELDDALAALRALGRDRAEPASTDAAEESAEVTAAEAWPRADTTAWAPRGSSQARPTTTPASRAYRRLRRIFPG